MARLFAHYDTTRRLNKAANLIDIAVGIGENMLVLFTYFCSVILTRDGIATVGTAKKLAAVGVISIFGSCLSIDRLIRARSRF